MKPYRPSNGTEGAYFQEAQCGSCAKEPTCKIAMLTMIVEEDDPEYPKEWVMDDDGKNPLCTARVQKPTQEQLEKFAIEVLRLASEGLNQQPRGMSVNGGPRWNPRVSKDVKQAARDAGFELAGEVLVEVKQ